MKDRVRVLFLCTCSACRSPMAAGWARSNFGGRVTSNAAVRGVGPARPSVVG